MPESALAKKLKRKSGDRAAIIGAPPRYEVAAFKGMGRASASLAGTFDWIQVFVKTQAELKRVAPEAARALEPASILWISFPKGTSNIQTDLTRDKGWESVGKLGLKWITLVSIDDTWSAFALRPYKLGEKRTRSWS